MNPHHLDLHAADLARRQHGAFSLRQLLAEGASHQVVRSRVRDRRFLELDTGVYAHPAHPATWHRQAKAAELRFPEGALSGRSAGVVHGIAGLRPGSLEVTVPPGAGRSCRLARVRHRVVPTTIVDGIRVITLEQVIADVASLRDPVLLEAVVEDVLLRGPLDPASIEAVYRRMVQERTKGAAVLGELLDGQLTATPPPSNEMERVLYRLLDEAFVPPYHRQAPFPWWPWAPQRVDAYVPAWRRIIEADGRLWHTRRTDFERDKWRDHLAQSNGIEVTRFTYRQLVRDPGYARRVLRQIGVHAAAA